MKKLYEKNELAFAIVCIIVYCVLQSFANPLNEKIGIEFSASAILCLLQAVILFIFIKKNNLLKQYGICKSSVSAKRFLYYVPLIILATGNLWNGVAVNYTLSGTACRIAGMLCVGFVEELIFRGFLFKAIAKDNIKSAIIISSVTFGIGHLINLFNGSGMDLVNNMCQICFAIAIGFLLVTLFYRSGSLLSCIFTHSAINILSTFTNEAGFTVEKQIVHCLIMIGIVLIYTIFLTKTLREKALFD